MPITVSDFNEIDHKVITLMGMSGVGKTYLSCLMAEQGWFHYSCDLEIGTRFLGAELEKTLARTNTVTAEDLSMLSEYVGRLGGAAQGGLDYDEFKRRQMQYYDAECAALKDLQSVVKGAVNEGYQNVINDSTGSLCEIDDETLIEMVDENSLIVYIKASAEEEKLVLQRAQDYPKPMFFSPEKFDEWVAAYTAEQGISSSDEVIPDDFGRWVFPKLFENRLPKYQRIADKYGVTIPSDAFKDVKTQGDFLRVITDHLPTEYKAAI